MPQRLLVLAKSTHETMTGVAGHVRDGLACPKMVTHPSTKRGWGSVILLIETVSPRRPSVVCLFVGVSFCLFVRTLTGKRLELSTPNLVHIYSIAVAQHALTHRSKVRRSSSHGYENCTVAPGLEHTCARYPQRFSLITGRTSLCRSSDRPQHCRWLRT